MFGRKKRVPVRICPQCGHEFREESAVCPLCSYDTGRRLLDQEETVDEDDKIDLLESLLGESNEPSETDESDVEVSAWSIKDLSYDDLDVVVDQYDDDGTVMVTAQGPSFAEVSQSKDESEVSDDLDLGEILGESPVVPEDAYETDPIALTTPPSIQPKNAETISDTSEVGVIADDDLDDFLDDIESTMIEDAEAAESRDTSLPSPTITASDTPLSDSISSTPPLSSLSSDALPKATVVVTESDDDLPTASVVNETEHPSLERGNDGLPSAIPVKSETSPDEIPKASIAPSDVGGTATDDLPVSPSQSVSAAVRAAPSPPNDVASHPPSGSIPSPVGVWPWPQHPSGASPTKRREMLKISLEAVKSNDLNGAAAALDRLGPVLGDDIDLIFHIGLLLKRLGRDNQLQAMLKSAQTMYPENEHVHRALGALV